MGPETKGEPIQNLEQLIAMLGFKETPEMTDFRVQINEASEAGKSAEEIDELFGLYYLTGIEEIGKMDQSDKHAIMRAILALDLQKALMNKKIGNEDLYRVGLAYIDDFEDFLDQEEYQFLKGL
jgi:hypothetical protein